MPRKLGEQIGGIRTLADLKLRCYLDPDSHCWEWRGAVQTRSTGAQEPRVWLADERRCETIPRASWLLSGKPVPSGRWCCWRRCRNDKCGNPAHLMVGTKAQWGEWAAGLGYLQGRPERSIINRRIKAQSGQTKLTMELAEWARESPQTGRDVAAALGVSESVVSRARLGQTWAPTAVSSVFAWRPA